MRVCVLNGRGVGVVHTLGCCTHSVAHVTSVFDPTVTRVQMGDIGLRCVNKVFADYYEMRKCELRC